MKPPNKPSINAPPPRFEVQATAPTATNTANKIPVGFTCVNVTLKANETKRIDTVIGHSHSEEHLLNMVETITNVEYLDQKRSEASNIVDEIIKDIDTETAFPIFDDYMRQNYLDNLLRGGYPMVIESGSKSFVYHLFSLIMNM